jgi:hypothetical protein
VWIVLRRNHHFLAVFHLDEWTLYYVYYANPFGVEKSNQGGNGEDGREPKALVTGPLAYPLTKWTTTIYVFCRKYFNQPHEHFRQNTRVNRRYYLWVR